MGTYRVHFKEILYSSQDVEAENEEQAREKFMIGNYDGGPEMQMSDFDEIVSIEEV